MLFGRKISDAEDGDLALQRRVVGELGEFLRGTFGRREFGLWREGDKNIRWRV